MAALAELAACAGANPELAARIGAATSVAEAFFHAAASGLDLGDAIAARAWITAAHVLAGSGIALEVLVFDRAGSCVGEAAFAST
jgi:cobalt-precorrin-5B (C1)-methyltransferase